MGNRPAPRLAAPPATRRPRARSAAALLIVVVALAATACGADPQLQRQESAVRSRTCESIIEREQTRPAPELAADRWLAETSKPPRKLTETINERQIIDGCADIEDQLDAVRGFWHELFTELAGSDAAVRSSAGAARASDQSLARLLADLGLGFHHDRSGQ